MMKSITVYDPPMCCSTGVCGTDVNQQLIDFAADLNWLKSQGVTVRRINLSQEPAEFAQNDEINTLMQATGGDDLPAILIDNQLVTKGCYPARDDLAKWVGVSVSEIHENEQPLSCSITKAKTSCCGG